MRINAWHRSISALVRPERSRPNTTATGERPQWATARRAPSRASMTGHSIRRSRAVVPSTRPHPASASSTDSTTSAWCRTSSAPAARAVASALGNVRGATRQSRSSPIAFIARAAAPMFPGWVGSTSTMRTRCRGLSFIGSPKLDTRRRRPGRGRASPHHFARKRHRRQSRIRDRFLSRSRAGDQCGIACRGVGGSSMRPNLALGQRDAPRNGPPNTSTSRPCRTTEWP